MAFTTKRGRPKTERPATDMGTPELQFKRAHGVTDEAIDLCLQKNIISEEQHWCGLHLRWLYTLRYGAPSISSTLRTLYDGATIRPDDPTWRSAREAEFADAVTMLHARACYAPVASLAIFNERPRFLNAAYREALLKKSDLRTAILDEYQRIIEGLTLLQTHWKLPQIQGAVTRAQQP
ncbi:MAG: hypothetical protein J0M34_00765 [Alphaproteobacteria bacterium]|nr:hypothetical protein [Alphaproteobacteria bacterium]